MRLYEERKATSNWGSLLPVPSSIPVSNVATKNSYFVSSLCSSQREQAPRGAARLQAGRRAAAGEERERRAPAGPPASDTRSNRIFSNVKHRRSSSRARPGSRRTPRPPPRPSRSPPPSPPPSARLTPVRASASPTSRRRTPRPSPSRPATTPLRPASPSLTCSTTGSAFTTRLRATRRPTLSICSCCSSTASASRRRTVRGE